MRAAYNGDTHFLSSPSPVWSQIVNHAMSSVTLSSNANPAAFGQQVLIRVTVTGSGGTPGGTVSLTEGSITLGTARLHEGVASLPLLQLSVGSHKLVAHYLGNNIFGESTWLPYSQSVTRAPTSTTLLSNLNPSNAGQQIIFTGPVETTNETLRKQITGPIHFVSVRFVLCW
jgi:hypothetical protein